MLKNFIKNIYTIIKTTPKEKSFYMGISFIFVIIFSIILLLNILSNKTISINNYNSELYIGTTQNIQYFINTFSVGEMEKNINKLLFAGLIKKDNNGLWENNLAESIDYGDGTGIKIKLKDNIYFSDGKPITTDDIIYTYTLFKNTVTDNEYSAIFDGIILEKINDKEININLKSPYPGIYHILNTGILNKDWMEKQSIANIKDINNAINIPFSGPYILKSYIKEKNKNIIELNRNPYNSPIANIKNIYIYNYNDNETMINDYNNNILDMMLDINNIDISKINKSYDKLSYTTPIYNFLFLNSDKAPLFAQNNERQKIKSIIDNNYIVDNILTGQGDIKNVIIQPSKVEDSKSVIIQNDKNSKSNKNTKPENKNLTLSIVNNPKTISIANYIKDKLSEIGYNIEIKSYNNQEIYTLVKERNFELLISGLEINNYNELYLYIHSSQKNHPGLNITSIYNKDLDNLLGQIKSEFNNDKVEMLEGKINAILAKENIWIPLYETTKNVIIKKDKNISLPDRIDYLGDLLENIQDNQIKKEYIWPIFYSEKINNNIINLLN